MHSLQVVHQRQPARSKRCVRHTLCTCSVVTSGSLGSSRCPLDVSVSVTHPPQLYTCARTQQTTNTQQCTPSAEHCWHICFQAAASAAAAAALLLHAKDWPPMFPTLHTTRTPATAATQRCSLRDAAYGAPPRATQQVKWLVCLGPYGWGAV